MVGVMVYGLGIALGSAVSPWCFLISVVPILAGIATD